MDLVTGTLLLLGAGFLVANARLAVEYLAVPQAPPRRAADLAGAASRRTTARRWRSASRSGCSSSSSCVLVHRQAFGETMMFLYYAYLLPLSRRIGRGFYEDGIWADSTFIPYNEVGGISWREGEHAVVADRDLTACAILHAGWPCRSSTTARRGGCCATRSASTRSTSPAPAWTLARTTSGTKRRGRASVAA